MAISIREHCIPAYDELARINRVQQLPEHIAQMEQETAGGIVWKIKAVLDSAYFKQLPESKTIVSGGIAQYLWKKSDAQKEMTRIWNECKDHLQ